MYLNCCFLQGIEMNVAPAELGSRATGTSLCHKQLDESLGKSSNIHYLRIFICICNTYITVSVHVVGSLPVHRNPNVLRNIDI